MTTNVPATTTAGGALSTQFAGGNPFLDAADDLGASSGALYTKFDGNTGIYSFGKDAEEIELGTEMAFAPSELKRGWICWKDSEVMEEIMVRVVDGQPPAKGDLKDHGPYEDKKDGWRAQASMQMRDVESGDEYLYKASSKGGTIALGNLLRDYGKEFQKHPGKLPVIALNRVSFDAKDEKGKKLGKKYAPKFDIVRWEDEQALMDKFALAAAGEDDGAGEEDDVPLNNAAPAGGRRRSFGG